MNLLIYAKAKTNRLRYTCELVFNELLGIDFSITTNFQEFGTIDLPKINYGDEKLKKVPFIKAHNLLFDFGIKDIKFEVENKGEVPLLFVTDDEHCDLKFDPFAAIFYMVSRYEEYLPFKADKFGRFPSKASIAHKHQFLQQPVVNLWVNRIKNILSAYYPNIKYKQPKAKLKLTFDIDMAYAYRNKGFLRNAGSIIKEISQLNILKLRERIRVISGLFPDPFYTFPYIMEQVKKYQLKPIYFFLVGEYGVYDKNISLEQMEFKNLIKEMADVGEIGLHPSYASNKDKSRLDLEHQQLEEVIKKAITKNRQHYLMVKLPVTYENLIELEMTEDHSMGYADQIGFRAGIASPFYFYNLRWEIKTKLKIVPFIMMDVTLKNYLKYSVEKSIDKSADLFQKVIINKGYCSVIWHNNSLSELEGWEGWRKLFEKQLSIMYENSIS